MGHSKVTAIGVQPLRSIGGLVLMLVRSPADQTATLLTFSASAAFCTSGDAAPLGLGLTTTSVTAVYLQADGNAGDVHQVAEKGTPGRPGNVVASVWLLLIWPASGLHETASMGTCWGHVKGDG